MEMTKTKPKYESQILLVDDDDNLRMIISDRLNISGHRVDEACCLSEAIERLENDTYQLVLLDVYLPDQDGLLGLRNIQERFPSLPIILMTAHGTIDLAVEAMKEGAYDFVTKPLDFKRLDVVVERSLENSQLRTEVQYLRRAVDQPFSDIIGINSSLKATMDLVRRVAPSDATVIIRGETGTGKEVIARAIHRLSPRRSNPFVVANCAAIPRDLMESEMFGHKHGAFTGAVANHSGFFETAGNGTLLLDEIGDLNLDLQAKILRVLEDGSYRKVGSSTTQHNHARVLTTTHQPLEKLMKEGRFREDLFYRLNVFPIELPPLRNRKEDIADLAKHFLRLSSREYPSREVTLSDSAVKVLQEHPWRGNLREMRNCMERLAIIGTGTSITKKDVRSLLHQNSSQETEDYFNRPLKDIEEQAIRTALDKFGGNRTKAAKALGIGRRTLQNKLKLYGLVDDDMGDE